MQNNQNQGSQKPSLRERVQNFGKGLQNVSKPGLLNKVIGGYDLVKAVVGRNSKGWYIKYVPIKPAKNLDRQMDPLFNLSVTDKPAEFGAITRFIDVHAEWTGFMSSYMYDRTVTEMFQLLRMRLKSNLPYSLNAVKAYLGQAIALAILTKQMERDVQWNLYASSDVHNFQKIWRLSSYSTTYGLVPLSPVSYLSDERWPYTSASYNRLADVFNYSVKLPESLGEFISHYCGSLFVADTDGKNDQFIRLYIDTVDWPEYDKATDTIKITPVNLSSLTPDQLIDLINRTMQSSSIIIADLTNSNQLVFSPISKLGGYDYKRVYDKTFLQALVNGYTSPAVLTPDKYVRLDQMETDDELTQFLFLGGLQSVNSNSDKGNVPAIKINNMVYKFDSDPNLKWPSGLFQQGDGSQFFTSQGPFGVAITSDISVDTYVGVTAGASKYVLFGEVVNIGTGNATIETQYSTDKSTWSFIPDGLNNKAFLPITAQIRDQEDPDKVEVNYKGLLFTFDPTTNNTTYHVGSMVKAVPSTGGLNNPANVLANLLLIANKFTTKVGSSVIPGYSDFVNDGWVYRDTSWSGAGWEDTTTLAFPLQTPLGQIIQVYVDFKAGVKKLISTTNVTTAYRIMQADSYFASNFISPIYVIINNSATMSKVAATAGFPLLAPWAADQFDYHLPMLIDSKVHVKNGSADDVIYSQGKVLVKEAYAPYYYQINDLVPVLYEMFTSLFATGARAELVKTQKQKADQHKQKRGDRMSDKDTNKSDSGVK